MRIGVVSKWVGAVGLVLVFALPAAAQGQREVTLIAKLAFEQVAQREAEAVAAVEAEHQAMLEEQSRLKGKYRAYLGSARRTAQKLVTAKRKKATQEQVTALRGQARVIIDGVQDGTKQRVPQELDPVYAQLEKLIALTPAEMHKAEPQLTKLRRELGRKNDVDWVDRAAILYAMAPSKRDGETLAGNVRFREKLSVDEAHAIDETNRRRLILGLDALAVDMKLVACSRDHSSDMIKHDFFAHESPVEGKKTPWDRARNFGTTASGENIAHGYKNGLAVTLGWWYSPGHLKNMMVESHRRVSVGQEQKHYTQMFGG